MQRGVGLTVIINMTTIYDTDTIRSRCYVVIRPSNSFSQYSLCQKWRSLVSTKRVTSQSYKDETLFYTCHYKVQREKKLQKSGSAVAGTVMLFPTTKPQSSLRSRCYFPFHSLFPSLSSRLRTTPVYEKRADTIVLNNVFYSFNIFPYLCRQTRMTIIIIYSSVQEQSAR